MAIARHVCNLDFAVFIKVRRDHADRRLDAMRARLNAAEMGQRSDHAHGPVTTHPEIRHVVEIQHAGYTGVIYRRTQECADERIRTAWLIDHRRTKIVVLVAETHEP